ncbi:MAG: hydroxyethylthiazole kinase [Spirochaetales bacterium]|nr:hydroxyethylthiazole kinase [Spirochaetales bacterium]
MDIYKFLRKVREDKPLVHHITNWVTIYDCANIVKVFGASPVMAHAKEEVKDMVNIASALVLNIGTLTLDIIEAMIIAGRAANNKGIPVILDVCGAGATKLRDDKCFEILDEVKISIIKGNSSEIARIAGENSATKGVDAGEVNKDLYSIAKTLGKRYHSTIVITGKEDIIADETGKCYSVENGVPMMANIVGTGCMATSVIGTFAAIEKNCAMAAAAGLCCFEIASEGALEKSRGPGSFKVNLFDEVFHLSQETIERYKKVVIKE